MSLAFMLSTGETEKDHFYPTPPDGTLALLSAETFDGAIWECACGAGDMSIVLEAAGYEVVSTDLVDRGYGLARVDFLMEVRLLAPNVVTNPPFKLGEQFVRKAFALGARKVAVLCRLNWLEGRQRRELFREYPLARVWVFTRRLSMRAGKTGGKGGTISYAWFVFDPSHSGPPVIGWINE